MKKNGAFTLMEILMVVTIIGLLAAVGFPLFSNAIRNAGDRVKGVHIARIESAKKQWAFENNKTNGTPVVWGDISNYVGGGIASLSDLDVDGAAITIHAVGTPASY